MKPLDAYGKLRVGGLVQIRVDMAFSSVEFGALAVLVLIAMEACLWLKRLAVNLEVAIGQWVRGLRAAPSVATACSSAVFRAPRKEHVLETRLTQFNRAVPTLDVIGLLALGRHAPVLVVRVCAHAA
jgi:hypothetical protein